MALKLLKPLLTQAAAQPAAQPAAMSGGSPFRGRRPTAPQQAPMPRNQPLSGPLGRVGTPPAGGPKFGNMPPPNMQQPGNPGFPGPQSPAIKTMGNVLQGTPTAAPATATATAPQKIMSGIKQAMSGVKMKSGGKVAGKLATRGYGCVKK